MLGFDLLTTVLTVWRFPGWPLFKKIVTGSVLPVQLMTNGWFATMLYWAFVSWTALAMEVKARAVRISKERIFEIWQNRIKWMR